MWREVNKHKMSRHFLCLEGQIDSFIGNRPSEMKLACMLVRERAFFVTSSKSSVVVSERFMKKIFKLLV